MRRSRFIKITFRAATAFVVVVAGIFALFIVEQRRTQTEIGAVLSAYLSDEVLNNAHDWGSGRGILIVLLREAQRPASWGRRWGLLFDQHLRFPHSSLTTRTSFVLSNVLATDIHAELRLPGGLDSVVVSRHDLEQSQSVDFQKRFPNNLGYIATSQPGFNFRKTEAILYIDHFCGLCGGGGYILMRKVNGVWRVVDQHGTWVS